jgi:hypothetical protein
MKTIKLMPDYQCFPLWEASPGEVGNINPEDLPISPDLKAQLAAWAKIYDATLNIDDPACSGFQSDEAEAEFKRVGNDLGQRLRGELGPDFTVRIKI